MRSWANLSSSAAVKAGVHGTLYSVLLTAGGDLATVTLKDGGSSGTTILVLKAAANTSASHAFSDDGVICYDLYATITGTSPSITVEYD